MRSKLSGKIKIIRVLESNIGSLITFENSKILNNNKCWNVLEKDDTVDFLVMVAMLEGDYFA